MSGAVEAGVTRATRDPSPTPAHKVQTTGPRSTPGPSSLSIATTDPRTPEISLDQQGTPTARAHSQLSAWQALSSSKAAPEIQASKEAKSSSVQDPNQDGSLISAANTEIPLKTLDAFHSSRPLSEHRSGIKSALFPDTVISDSLSTHEGKYEEGASISLAETIRSPSSDDGRGQIRTLSDLNLLSSHGRLPRESKYPQGKATAEPGLLLLENQLNSGTLTDNHNPPIQTEENSNGSSTDVYAELDDLTSVASSARNPDAGSIIEFSTHAPLHNPPQNSLPNNQGKQQPQTLSPISIVDGGLTSATMIASESSSVSDSKPDPLIHSPALTGINSRSSMSGSNMHEASAPAIKIAPKESSDMTPDPLPPLSIPSSEPFPVLADANTLKNLQSEPSNSIKAVFRNQTAPVFVASGTSTAERRARASSTSKNFGENTTVLPYKSGDERSTTFRVLSVSICLVLSFLSLLV